jgi:glycyl-tRNA synthetase beta chain
MIKPLLIEIGLQELPAIPLLKELPNIENKWLRVLEKYSLNSGFELYYTPRRITIYHNEFASKQEDSYEEFYGAPLDIAYKDGVATKAALSFAKKCGVDIQQLSSATKGSKEVLYYKKFIKGKDVSLLLDKMVKEFVKSLKFGKSMRWENNKESFIRPIVSYSVIFGEKTIEADLYGIKSLAKTFVHRDYSYNLIEFNGIDEYFKTLSENGVVL